MVNLKSIQKANGQLCQLFSNVNPVAVFIGATNGVGRNTIKAFVKAVRGSKPRIYFLGRSRQRGNQLLSELLAIDPDGRYEFISADASRMASVDKICGDIKQKEQYINLLFMSQATAWNDIETSEKLPVFSALGYYSKVRFAVNLLPLLKNASVLRRVVSVFGAGAEGEVLLNDLDGRTSPMTPVRDSLASMLSLSWNKLTKDAPDVSFVHTWPGFVESGIVDEMPGALGVILRTLLPTMGFFFYMSPSECGERQLFMATSARFPPVSEVNGDRANGTALVDGLRPIVSTGGKLGGGSYSVKDSGHAILNKKIDLLVRYQKDDTQSKIWKHTIDTYKELTDKESLRLSFVFE